MNIKLENISKHYEDTVVFNGLNMEIQKGRITCIMGPSGCGKTTLLSILMGLVKPDSGKVYGLERKRIGAVFQEDRLCEGVSVLQNIKMVCRRKVSDEQIAKELEKVGLAGMEKKKVSELSGGMKRRVAIVRAIMAETDLLIMDEPFKGLDETLKFKVIEYVKEKTAGKTLIIVTHDRIEAEALMADIIHL
ncbi:MAG: NitT/TauT family transport system ATP-binding protein [Lachnoclostridium sp.]|jgi:NitT/TauT family transport system ATP-binding protein